MWFGMKKVFYPKRDAFYISAYIIIVLVIITIMVLAELLIEGTMRHIMLVIMGIAGVILSVFYFRLKYIVSDSFLTIIFGFLKIDIKKSDILNIEKVKKVTKSFALSRECLCIYYGKSQYRKYNKFYLSPRNTEDFISEIGGSI